MSSSKKVSVRYLIDIALGNTEPGIVNFNALNTVLQLIIEKLQLDDEEIEISSSYGPAGPNFDSKSNTFSEKLVEHQVYEKHATTSETLQPPKLPPPIMRISEDQKREHKPSVVTTPAPAAEGDEDGLPAAADPETKKCQKLAIKQQLECLFDRFSKIENLAIWSVDTEQNVECVRLVADRLQERVDMIDKTLFEMKELRYRQAEDLSACRIKQEYENLQAVTYNLKKEFETFRQTVNTTGMKNIQIYRAPEPDVKLEDILRIEEQLVEIKNNICVTGKKIEYLTIKVEETDHENTMLALKEYCREALNELKCEIECLIENTKADIVEDMTAQFDDVRATKLDKEEAYELLAEKADYSIVHQKVSIENMNAEMDKIDRQLSEISNCVTINDENATREIERLKQLVGDVSLAVLLGEFEAAIKKEILKLAKDLQKLMDAKPDYESAASRLRDLSCLSCDQDVVMITMEPHLAKFKDAHTTKTISPLVAFECGKLRERGKVEFVNDKAFSEVGRPRHCCGAHTIITAQDRADKIKPVTHDKQC